MRGHVRKRGNTYSVVLFVGYKPDGKPQYKWYGGHRTKKEADKFLAEKIKEFNDGNLATESGVTVRKYFEAWLEHEATQVRVSTLVGYKSIVNAHILPNFGGKKLDKLKPLDIQRLYDALLTSGKAPRTVIHLHTLLHSAFGRAVKWGMLTRNIVEQVEPPHAKKHEFAVWTRDQVLAYLQEAEKTRYYVLFLLALTTGLRLGELQGLKWIDVDFEQSELHVKRSRTWKTGEGLDLHPKTAHGRRIVALSGSSVAALRKHKAFQAEEKLRSKDYQDGLYIVTREDGVVPHPVTIRELHTKLCKRAGVPYIRIHDMRHTHATLLLEQGVHPKIVSERLGHSAIGITLDTYTHVLPSLQHKTAKDFDDALFGGKNG